MPRVSSTIGLAVIIALVMLVGVSLRPQSLSPFDKYAYNSSPSPSARRPAPVSQQAFHTSAPSPVVEVAQTGVPAPVAQASGLAKASAAAGKMVGPPPSPDQKPYDYDGPILIMPDNLEKDIEAFKARQKKEEEKRQKEEKKKKEAAEKKKKEDEKKKKEEEEKKKKAEEKKKEEDKKKEEENKKKKEEDEKKSKEEEEKKRIADLATDDKSFDSLKEKVEKFEKELEPLKKDLEAAKKHKEETKKKAEDMRKDQEKEAAKKLSNGLQGDFHKLERAEIKSIVENPLNYTAAEKNDGGHVAPYGNKVVILSASNNKTESEQYMLERALLNRQEYCNMHGYTCTFINLDDVDDGKHHIVWAKIKAIELVFATDPDVEWVWWMDTDMVILNPYLELGEHLLSDRALVERLSYGRPIRAPDASFKGEIYHAKGEVEAKDIHLLLTQDFFGINAGSFFLRKSQFSKFLLDLWYDQHFIDKNYVFREQQALNHLLRSHKTVLQHTGLYPQRLFNSYLGKEDEVWTYKESDLAVHFAGCGSSRTCKDKFSRYMKVRQRVPEEFQVEFPKD
ncbi:Alpha-1,2-galactosyltransferase [Yarrowia sp. C11]|nr:Alpha-1,2-galactosyltransferase [Yarrowia sp. E02]KAG5372317.1 Alpha-1,2-galactosyltransferase [Yarrowia sp. C11]